MIINFHVLTRPKLQLFLTQMHQPDGSYVMHRDGEVDVRYSFIVKVTIAIIMDCFLVVLTVL